MTKNDELDEDDRDEDDHYSEEDRYPELCEKCGIKTIGEGCEECGANLCPMCFECGGGRCGKCNNEPIKA